MPETVLCGVSSKAAQCQTAPRRLEQSVGQHDLMNTSGGMQR